MSTHVQAKSSIRWLPCAEVAGCRRKQDVFVRTVAGKVMKGTILEVRLDKGGEINVTYESEGKKLQKKYVPDDVPVTHFALR